MPSQKKGGEPKAPPRPALLTSTEAAKHLGVSQQRVRALIAEGRLPATRFGHVWMIREADLAAFVRLPRGRPKAAKEAAHES